MAHYLLLGNSSQNWRLHVSENPGRVLSRLQAAFDQSSVAQVKVTRPESIDADEIQVNPRALGWWSVVDLGEPDA